jgi:DNA-binding transcriptional LysR family regulator
MLSTIHLQTFLAVVEAGNYSAAAERLHMSQPAVSQHIRALELQFDNVRLFRRVGQQMLLTHAGEELAEVAREMLALALRAEENVRALKGQVSGRVTIGCLPSSAERLLPPVLAAFRARYSAISVTVTMAPQETLLDWLASQQIQVVIAEEAHRRRGWESQLLGVERLALMAPRGHELLQHDRVLPGMLRGVPLVLARSGTPIRRAIEDTLRRRGVGTSDLNVVLETDGSALTVQAVRLGMGLAFIPQSRMPRTRDIGVVDLAGVYLQQEWHALRVRERGAPRAVQELYGFLVGQEGRTILSKEGLKPPAE